MNTCKTKLVIVAIPMFQCRIFRFWRFEKNPIILGETRNIDSYFLFGAFINKRARLLESLSVYFLSDSLKWDEFFVQFAQLNDYLGTGSKLWKRSPFHF